MNKSNVIFLKVLNAKTHEIIIPQFYYNRHYVSLGNDIMADIMGYKIFIVIAKASGRWIGPRRNSILIQADYILFKRSSRELIYTRLPQSRRANISTY